MNQLTDIINEVASEIGVQLTAAEQHTIQNTIFDQIMNRVSWCKHERLKSSAFHWLAKTGTN